MRYYDIVLTAGGSKTPYREWTSHPNGVFDPNALDIEFDCQVANFAASPQIFTVTIRGVSLQDLSQAQQFTGMQFSMKGGMQAGLPLANPKQAGLLVSGEVLQAYGNWEGIDMRLDLVIGPSTYTLNEPGNLVLNWQAGQSLSQALQQTFAVAYPNVPLTANVSSQLVQNFDEVHFCSTLQEMAQCVQGITQGYFLGPGYSGVNITAQNGQFSVWDSTYNPKPIQINFTDFVGQPTWIDVNTMICKLVLRADIQLGAVIQMPQGMQNQPGAVTTSPQQYYPSSANSQTAFQGAFNVSDVRHIGSYRSPDGASWITVIKCLANDNSAIS